MSSRPANAPLSEDEPPVMRIRPVSEYGPEDWAKIARAAEETRRASIENAEAIAWHKRDIERRGLWNGREDDD